MSWMQRIPWRSLGRWWIVGLSFTAAGLGIVYLLTGVLHLPLLVGTTVCAEFTIVLRFLTNDRWVFGHRRPTWTRLWQFHIASAGGGAVWWLVANSLPRFGINYLIASLAGTACSVGVSMVTNFLWIWRDRKQSARNPPPVSNEAEVR